MSRRVTRHMQRWLTPRLRQNRGFAILLFSYFIISLLLTWTVATVTRTAMDLLAAQRGITLIRAFWAAEGVLEQAMRQISLAPNPEGIPTELADDLPTPVPDCVETPTPVWSNDVSVTNGTYHVCLDETIASTSSEEHRRYQIEATGTIADLAQTLVTVIDYHANLVTFNQMVWSEEIDLSSVRTGAMDTTEDPLILTGTSEEGDIASPLEDLREGCVGGPSACAPIRVMDGSEVHGTAYVGPTGSLDLVAVEGGSDIFGTPKKDNLTTVMPLPIIEIPTGTTDLASVIPHEIVSETVGAITQDAVIPAGVYTVSKRLLVTSGARVCTSGHVEIYMEEMKDMKVANGQLFGQPSDSTDCAQEQYSPIDLQFFHTTAITGAMLIEPNSTATIAAIYYVPTGGFELDTNLDMTWVGGGIFDERFALRRASGTALLLYDEALRGERVRVGPAAIMIETWKQGS